MASATWLRGVGGGAKTTPTSGCLGVCSGSGSGSMAKAGGDFPLGLSLHARDSLFRISRRRRPQTSAVNPSLTDEQNLEPKSPI